MPSGNFAQSRTQLGIQADFFLVVGLFLIIQALTFNQIEEDAFIYLRTAQNILDGCGYVFNCHGPTIETGSSLVWQAIVAAMLKAFPEHILLSLKLLEIGISLLSLWLITLIASKEVKHRFLVIVPALLLCISTPFYTWSQRVMGTPQHLLMLIWFLYACLYRCRGGWALPASLLFMGRPEGFLFVGAGMIWLLFNKPLRENLRGILLLGAICLIVEVGRIVYFHELFPISIYHKLRGDWERGWSATRLFFLNAPLSLLLIPSAFIALQPRYWTPQKLLITLMLATGVLWAIIGEDWKDGNRALLSGLAIACLWIAQNLDVLAKSWPRSTQTLIAAVIIPTLVIGPTISGFYQVKPNSLILNFIWASNQDSFSFWSEYKAMLANPNDYLVDRYDPIGIPILGHHLLATTGKFIAANYPKGITIVYDQMGQAPWYAGTDKTFIDGAGLTDRDIAHLQLDMQQNPPTVLSLHAYIRDIALRSFNQDTPKKQSLPIVLNDIFNAKPEVIIIMNHHHNNPNHAVMHGLLTDPRLASGYYPAYKVNHFNTFYHRNDMAMPAQDIIPFTTEVQRFDTPATRPEP